MLMALDHDMRTSFETLPVTAHIPLTARIVALTFPQIPPAAFATHWLRRIKRLLHRLDLLLIDWHSVDCHLRRDALTRRAEPALDILTNQAVAPAKQRASPGWIWLDDPA